MVIVVPAFAEGDRRDECVITRIVTRFKSAAAPQMRCRIDQPSKMPADRDSHNDRPDDHRPSANREQDTRESQRRNVVVLIEKPEIRILHQIGRIFLHRRLRLTLGRAAKYPADVRPIGSVTRAVRIFVAIGKGVMNTVRRDPSNRARLQTERSTRRQKAHHPGRCRKTAMRQKPVIGNADAPARCDPPANKSRNGVLPAKGEQCRHCNNMERRYKKYRVPI